jgi:FkbM family methyltransferase
MEPETVLLPYMCDRNALAVDIGANLGLYIHHFLSITNSVVAFEPLLSMQDMLRRVYGKRIRLEPFALSDAPGFAELKFPEGNFAWATIEPSNNLSMADSAKIRSQTTELRTLDSYNFENVGIIKIDVEGHEEAVLLGGRKTLQKNFPSLLIEIEERHNKGAIERIKDLLNKLGYVGFFLDDGLLRGIEDFNAETDQPLKNVCPTGKTGRYINNFIFIPRNKADQFRAAATSFLAG